MRIALMLPILVVAPAWAQSSGSAGASRPGLAACSAQPDCASILKPFEASEVGALSDSARLVAAVIQASAAMATQRPNHERQIAGAGYCVKTRTPGDSVVVSEAAAPMQTRLPRVRWCQPDEALPNPPRRGRVLPEPGTQVVGLSVNSITATDDDATARFVIGSTSYQCQLVRETGIWRPESCVLTGTG
jgi:hypothetical protein